MPGWPTAFRGSSAVAAGLITWDRLRGPRFRRVFPDVYVPAASNPSDPLLRACAAYRLVEGRGVLSGYSAALVLGADCAPAGHRLAEVTVPGGGQRAHPWLSVRRDRLHPGEVTEVGGLRCTTPLRTAFDLARRLGPVEAVVAVDRIANTYRFPPDLLLNFCVRYRGMRGVAVVAGLLASCNPYSGSPMETRLRLLIADAGLPRPQVQWVVQDVAARTAVWIDLAYPELQVGVEYDGADHTRPEQVLADIGRTTRLVDRGWRLYRYTKLDIRHDPRRIVDEVARAVTPRRT